MNTELEKPNKRAILLERAVGLFGDAGIKRSEHIRGALAMTGAVDHIEYTDEALRDLLNDVVYDKASDNLFTKYVVPPFSILDTRNGYWQERKRAWLSLTGNLTATKENVLADGMMAKINGGSSNFDPVLAEVMFKWFNLPHGSVLDPFGGEQTKGVVAGYLGMLYLGCELRQEQVDYNIKMAEELPNVSYVCGDSRFIDQYSARRDFDFVLTSPPYYDLEIYSEKSDDLSTMGTFDEFMRSMFEIYAACYDMLADNRFFVVKVGEIRDKKTGVYRNFVGETIKALEQCGLHYYNDIVLVNAVGTAPMRASNTFTTRKIVKLHQNLLVFFKGDVRKIPELFTNINDFSPMPVFEQGTLL